MQAYEYDETGYESPLDNITKELEHSDGFRSNRGKALDDYSLHRRNHHNHHHGLIDDEDRDAISTGETHRMNNPQLSFDENRFEVEGSMVDDGMQHDDQQHDDQHYADDDDGDGYEYRGYVTDRDADKIIDVEHEGNFNDFSYDDNEGPSEPFETNYYDTVDDDSEIGHDDDDDDGDHDVDRGAKGTDTHYDYDNDSLDNHLMGSSNYYSIHSHNSRDDDDDDDDDVHDRGDDVHGSSTRSVTEKGRVYYNSSVGEDRRYITIADDWEQLNLEELSRLSLASI